MPPQWLESLSCGLPMGPSERSMLCSGFRRALAPLGKAVFKGENGDASKPPPDGSVRVWKAEFRAGCKSLLCYAVKKTGCV